MGFENELGTIPQDSCDDDNGKEERIKHLTRIRRENPAFNYGFFRPNPLAFEREAGKNAGHGSDFTGPGNPEQAEIARSGSGRDSAQTF